MKGPLSLPTWTPGKATEVSTWDVDREEKLVRKWASKDGSGDKEQMDWAKYGKAFGLIETSDRENFGSYHYLHHCIRDGDLCVAWEALPAVLNRLGYAPTDVRRSLYNHIKKHYQQFKKEPPPYRFERIIGDPMMRPGTWNGHEVTDAMLQQTADDYEPLYHRAPVSIDHKFEGLGDGWVSRAYYEDGMLKGDYADVPTEIADAIRENRLLSRSVVLNPNEKNELTELLGVGLMGANVPAVTGLPPLSESEIRANFASEDAQVLTCTITEDDDMEKIDRKTVFERARDFFKTAFGMEIKVDGDGGGGTVSFPDDETGKLTAELADANTKLVAAEKKLAEQADVKRLADAEAVVDRLVADKKIVPAVKEAGLAQLLAALSASETRVTFEKKGESLEMGLDEALAKCFEAQPKLGLSGEAARAEGGEDSGEKAEFAQKCAELAKEKGRELTGAEMQQVQKELAEKAGGAK